MEVHIRMSHEPDWVRAAGDEQQPGFHARATWAAIQRGDALEVRPEGGEATSIVVFNPAHVVAVREVRDGA